MYRTSFAQHEAYRLSRVKTAADKALQASYVTLSARNTCSDGGVHPLLEICSVELIFASGGINFTIRLCRACETLVSKHSHEW